MVGEYMTNCCLYSAHKLCQITWYSGLLAQLEQHIIVGICCLSQVPKPIWKMSGNTCKIPETTGKQPSKEGELKCYECGQKGHMQP